MKISSRFFLPLLGLFQNVQVAQSTQLFFNEDGSDSPLGAAICLLLPCVDPALGARNFLAPVIGPPMPDGKAGEDPASTQSAESVVMHELANVAGQMFYSVLDQQLQRGANDGDLAGQTIVDVNDESASQQLRDVALAVVNGLIDQMQQTYISGTTSTETGDLATPPVSDTTTATTAATTTTTTTTSALVNLIDGGAVSERVRQVALGLVATLFDRLADDETTNGGVRRQLRGVTSASDVPLTESVRMV